ncbi:hypothetical protein GPECTOR_17g891 [Gonium pectorale]|uniref:Uncharacterized protein n=1 Tax=Gonium pectorale TaxID=33097 RepID=A0A150GK87_GONPE|nr:hypothetical protein GPECTOR_17g891 [Gonium pectorale]|eukprot:KXZ50253.1 hypothetical protein GPECTOR_17g891 [Gonium pectorale]
MQDCCPHRSLSRPSGRAMDFLPVGARGSAHIRDEHAVAAASTFGGHPGVSALAAVTAVTGPGASAAAICAAAEPPPLPPHPLLQHPTMRSSCVARLAQLVLSQGVELDIEAEGRAGVDSSGDADMGMADTGGAGAAEAVAEAEPSSLDTWAALSLAGGRNVSHRPQASDGRIGGMDGDADGSGVMLGRRGPCFLSFGADLQRSQLREGPRSHRLLASADNIPVVASLFPAVAQLSPGGDARTTNEPLSRSGGSGGGARRRLEGALRRAGAAGVAQRVPDWRLVPADSGGGCGGGGGGLLDAFASRELDAILDRTLAPPGSNDLLGAQMDLLRGACGVVGNYAKEYASSASQRQLFRNTSGPAAGGALHAGLGVGLGLGGHDAAVVMGMDENDLLSFGGR